VNVVFACPTCENPGRATLDRASDWECPRCDQRQHFEAAEPALTACALCGNHELYKQKDFPHRFGLFVLIAAFVLSIYTYGWYEKWLTYAILIGTAIFDGALYLWVGDAIVCYRCGSYHKGFKPGPECHPFEITTGERYRQERIRKDRLKAKQG